MTSDFQLWKDYFQLAKVVERIYREEDGLKETSLPEHGEASLEGNGQAEGLPCSFCKNNGESKHVYMSHRLKDATGRVRCPILRNYTCPQCGASDDAAHTRRFCPLTNKGYTSVYNSSIRNSAGKKKKGDITFPEVWGDSGSNNSPLVVDNTEMNSYTIQRKHGYH